MKRREFLKRGLAGVGAAMAVRGTAQGAENEGIVQPGCWDPYEQEIPLGKTKIKVSRMCLGTGMRGYNRSSNHTRMGQEKFEGLIRGAYERGVRVFDLADLYGTHPYVVRALKDVPRKKYVIISKIWFRNGGLGDITERPRADKVVERFLKEMGTDYIDLVQLHCVVSKDWNKELAEDMEALESLKEKGVIRGHGVSCHSVEALETAAGEDWVDVVHARVNAYGTKMDHKDPAVVAAVLKRIHDGGKGVIGMKLVGEGQFRDDDQKKDRSIEYVLGLGCVDVLNVGCENLEEVDDFAMRVGRTKKAVS